MASAARSITYWALLVCAAVILLLAGTAKADVIDFTGLPFNTWDPGPMHYAQGSTTDLNWELYLTSSGSSAVNFGYYSKTADGQTAEGIGSYGGSLGNEMERSDLLTVCLAARADGISPVELQSFTVNGLHYYTDASGTPNYWESFEYSTDKGTSWTSITQSTASGQNGGPYAAFTPGELTVHFAPGLITDKFLIRVSGLDCSGFVLNELEAAPPVPEPGSMILFGSAAGLMGWYRRRKSAKKSS